MKVAHPRPRTTSFTLTTTCACAFGALLLALAGCGDDTVDPDDVTLCDDAAAAYASVCTDDGVRTCQVATYATYCATASDPAAAAAALDCLRLNSDSGSCRTFADPSGAASCVETALANAVSAEARRIADAHFALCQSYLTTPFRFEPPFALLSSTQIEAAGRCIDEAATCADADACLAAGPQAPFAACFD